jgi:hypothetical protein
MSLITADANLRTVVVYFSLLLFHLKLQITLSSYPCNSLLAGGR